MGKGPSISRRHALISSGLAVTTPLLPATRRSPSVGRNPDATATPALRLTGGTTPHTSHRLCTWVTVPVTY